MLFLFERGGFINIPENILDAIEIIVDERIKNIKVNYKIEGLVLEVLEDRFYKVRIDGVESKIKSISSEEFIEGDVVVILVFNNNYSDKRILGLK